jgi:tetratricopeptide (TPR) repeat protein
MKTRRATWIRALILAVSACALPTAAEHRESWTEIKSPHFTVYANAGERDGKRVALEFEQIRAMFEQSFPKLRVDSGGKPTIIYALKNEDSLKLLIPAYGRDKGATKLAGLYRQSSDKNFALIRTDVTGTGSNPYHVVYHEYAHGLFRLNYRGLPLWLDEGLAEYWGGSAIQNKGARTGMADVRQIRLLQQYPLLPIATLVSIDGASPLYNTQDHSGMFYAESWALVHYLAMAPEIRDQNLLNKYLAALEATDDPIEAAHRTFGDLKKLEEQLESYVHRRAYYYNDIKLHGEVSEKEFTVRALSTAEGLVHQGDYLLHANHLPEAIALLHEAERIDPKVRGLYDGLGYYYFLKADYDNADKQFALALADNPGDAGAYFYRASILYRRSGYTRESTPQIIAGLEKVLALEPDFAPAHAFLSMAYIASPAEISKAIPEAARAVNLEPGNMAYFIDYGRALLANGKQAEARQVADRASRTATWQPDRTMATNFLKAVNHQASLQAREPVPGGAHDRAASEADEEAGSLEPSVVSGRISEVTCGHFPAVMFTLTTPGEQFLFQVKDVGRLERKDSAVPGGNAPAVCSAWKDRKAKVSYRLTPDGPAFGEVLGIAFE